MTNRSPQDSRSWLMSYVEENDLTDDGRLKGNVNRTVAHDVAVNFGRQGGKDDIIVTIPAGTTLTIFRLFEHAIPDLTVAAIFMPDKQFTLKGKLGKLTRRSLVSPLRHQ